MPETDALDQLLRRSLSARPAPTLSSEFGRRLDHRLAPRRLSRSARGGLLAYGIVGVACSVGAMRASGMDSLLAGLSLLVPAVVGVAVVRTFYR